MPLTAPGIALALAISAAQDPAALAHRVQTYYEKTKDIEANFVQTYTYAAAMHGQTSSGMLRAKKPGKLRWDYLEPAKKTIVVNGSRLVQYEPEANQAYLDEHFDASAMSAAVTFLLGTGRLEKEFTLSSTAQGELTLTPKKPDSRVESIVLTVGKEGDVTATRVVDGQGNVNSITFTKLRQNVGLKDSAFVLDLPRDVHVLNPPH